MTLSCVVGGSVIAVSLLIFTAGMIVSFLLYELDEQFGISESIIRELKKQRKVRADGEGRYHADTFFTNFHRFG
ncbi:hypothetical protein UA45_22900 [Morganella morganii]|uniref:Uncharacterized protein n=1 Tax=Morganella morganii TaxID=582 RepID=A0A0D8L2R6_MORMO|nr:hypothetical protein UA45_22900 [Morganella morganii]